MDSIHSVNFSALGITKLRESTKIPPDSAVAVLLSAGLAVGVILIGLAGGFTLDLYSFLFGSILLVSMQDQEIILVASALILSILYFIYRELVYIAFDEEQAQVSGINVSRLNYIFIVLASIVVITSIRLVGVLLHIIINSNPKHYRHDVWERLQRKLR